MTDAEWTEEVRRTAIRLAGIFGAINTEVSADSMAGKLAHKGGIAALALSDLAAKRNITAEVSAEAKDVAASDYDLSALATAPPATLED